MSSQWFAIKNRSAKKSSVKFLREHDFKTLMFLVRKVLIGEKVCITFYVGSVWDQLRIENKNFGQQTLMKPVTTRHLTRAGCHVLAATCVWSLASRIIKTTALWDYKIRNLSRLWPLIKLVSFHREQSDDGNKEDVQENVIVISYKTLW